MSKKKISIDGNYAAAHASYAFTEVAGIYPITPSSNMAEYTDEWASQGKKNLFGMPVKVIEMQSEAGAAGTVHGSLQAGALTTTYTASQGLLLKIPNMYKIAGQQLPGVIHVSARALASQALSIFGDHQDVMSVRQTGFAMLASGSVQEVMDLAGIAHLSAIKSSIPFLHFFDGFRTSHEVNTVEPIDYAVFDKLLDKDAVQRFRDNALNPAHPKVRGTAQNDDVYFQTRELHNMAYSKVADVVNDYMQSISKETGRSYAPFNYYGDKDATDVIIAMGSVSECIRETVDYLMTQGKKVGFLAVHLYRPFSSKYFFDAMPKTVKRISVLDRTIEPGSLGEPLLLDVKSLYFGKADAPVIIGGRYGLSSKDTTPSMINAVYENLSGEQKDGFTLGIIDDITFKSLEVKTQIDVADKDTTELLFFGVGSDGTVGASKNISKIVGDNTELYSQSYSSYDSKKSGGVTRMHLRFSPNPIRSTYLVNNPHFVSCSNAAYLPKYEMINGIREGGTFLLNTTVSKDEVEKLLPNSFKKILAERNVKLYIINANAAAKECGFRQGLGVNTIMQSAFFKLNEQIMPFDEAVKQMKTYATKTYINKGQPVVDMNLKAIDMGYEKLVEVEVKSEWANLSLEAKKLTLSKTKFTKEIVDVVNAIKGDTLPVSKFTDYKDGSMPVGTTAVEKRGIASHTPKWLEENCIQCNLCSFVCPHATIRPFLVDAKEEASAPKETVYLKPVGKGEVFENCKYTVSVSPLDCTGCGVCINVCPGRKGVKALEPQTLTQALDRKEQEISDYLYNEVSTKSELLGTDNVKNLQFAKPFFEFSGACAGCGETAYIKTITQLFGDRMLVANATGCTSIYSGSYPVTPYTTDASGRGPAWANSLFEDNAEFGYGMRLAHETMRDRIQTLMVDNFDKMPADVKSLSDEWITNRKNGEITKQLAPKLVKGLEGIKDDYAKQMLELKDHFVKISQWIIGGDGWAYDIGYGGLDHVIANKDNVNILIVDTEVYSNTGGQSSKSSASGSIAKFTASGKKGKKKDLASIAMQYGHVYVATLSQGSSPAQTLKAIKEAEAYDGPSIIIAYSTCIAHNIKGGLYNSLAISKKATECGYWPLFRFNPDLALEGKNPFIMDSKEPDWSKYEDFLNEQGRYSQLKAINPEFAKELFDNNLEHAKERYERYTKLANDSKYNN